VTQPSTGGGTLTAIQPKDASIKVYSSTAAELFWTPAGKVRPVIENNEIRRDGTLIATVQGEFLRSYFDGNREPGKRYSYEITAISSAGRASTLVSDSGFTVAEPVQPPTTTTPVGDLSAALRTKLNTTFDIINGVPVERVMATLGRLSDRNARSALGLLRTGSRVNLNGSSADVYSCPEGGELLDSQSDVQTGRFSYEVEINDCAIGPIVFSAFAQIGEPSASDGFRPSSVNALDIQLDDARDLSTTTSENIFFFSDATDPRFSSWSAYKVAVDRPQDSYSAGSMNGNGRDQNNALPDGSFGLTTNASNVVGATAGISALRTLGPLEFANGRENAVPSGGRVSMGSGSESLSINAFNGDPDTFTLTSASGNTTTSYTVKFSDIYRFEAPVISSVDIGF